MDYWAHGYCENFSDEHCSHCVFSEQVASENEESERHKRIGKQI
jgi:hypothetical protein